MESSCARVVVLVAGRCIVKDGKPAYTYNFLGLEQFTVAEKPDSEWFRFDRTRLSLTKAARKNLARVAWQRSR